MSTLVADLLRQVTSRDTQYDSIWAEEERLMAEGIGMRVGPIKWTRDELHEQ